MTYVLAGRITYLDVESSANGEVSRNPSTTGVRIALDSANVVVSRIVGVVGEYGAAWDWVLLLDVCMESCM